MTFCKDQTDLQARMRAVRSSPAEAAAHCGGVDLDRFSLVHEGPEQELRGFGRGRRPLWRARMGVSELLGEVSQPLFPIAVAGAFEQLAQMLSVH